MGSVTITQIAVSAFMAIVLGFWIYLGKLKTKSEPFSVTKLVRTAIIGAILGALAGFTGYDLTASNWEVYLAANTGVIAFIDPLFKTILTSIGLKFPTDLPPIE